MPYIRVFQIKSAVDQNDLDRLSEFVDFPILRQNLHENAKQMMNQTVSNGLKKNVFVWFGMNLASSFTEKMIDTIITPSVIAELMRGSMASLHRSSQVKVITSDGEYVLSDPLKNAKLGYKSLSRFSILLTIEGGQHIEFILSRTGIEWKLTHIKFLMDADAALAKV